MSKTAEERKVIKEKHMTERQRMRMATARMAKLNADTISVKFLNLEAKGEDVMFTHGDITYHLYDTFVYDLPKHTVEHLNSLMLPIYDNVYDEKMKQEKSKKVGERNRFMVVPEMKKKEAKREAV